MKWKEYLRSIAETPRLGLMTLATTGLDPARGDELIGIAFHIFEDGGNDTHCPKLLKLCTVENLQKSMDYHKVSQQMIVREGYDEHTWKSEFRKRTGDQPICWFTYNPQFAEMFLNTLNLGLHIHDFSRTFMFAHSKMPFQDFRTLRGLDEVMNRQVRPPAIRSLTAYFGESCAEAPGQLPMTTMLEALCRMAHILGDIECPVEDAI